MVNSTPTIQDNLLDAASRVVAAKGIGNLTLDAVAAEAGMSKGGLLHHFPSKDRLVEAMVERAASCWQKHFTEAYEKADPGPGRMVRGLLKECVCDAQCWTEQLRTTWSAVFAALAQNPSLIASMRAAYDELYERIAEDGLPSGAGETIMAAIDGLWLEWVFGLVPLHKERVVRVRVALEGYLAQLESTK